MQLVGHMPGVSSFRRWNLIRRIRQPSVSWRRWMRSIDAEAREQVLSSEDRHTLRLQKSKPLLEEIKSQIQAARTSTLPKSVLAEACNYTLTLWTRLTRFMEHPELELSNNLAENSMRPVALGRRYEQSGIRQSWNGEEDSHFDCPIVA